MHTTFRSKRITVMGLGQFGGGAGVTRWLASQGARVLVTDMQPAAKLEASIAELAPLIESGSVSLRLGSHDESDFTDADLVIANPAVPKPWLNRYLCAAATAGVPITTEIRLLIEQLNRNRVVGITGSAGKSTTTAMIHHALLNAGLRAHLGGNIGGSLLGKLDLINADEWIVLELSSAMLHWLSHERGEPWSPHIAVLTNITPNHIDWHGTFDHYRQSKLNIFRNQKPGDLAITSESLPEPIAKSGAMLIAPAQQPNIRLAIPGEHNRRNAALALCVVEEVLRNAGRSMARSNVESLLADFRGLPHRLQLIAERGGMKFYNDSKSTTPEATLLAVAAFDNPASVHLIAGGYDKGSDLSPISQLCDRIAGLYAIGTTGRTIAAGATNGFAAFCDTLENAVNLARSRMKPGDILLLSPGCASWDQFTNYERRGEMFTALVNQTAPAAELAR